ncbi:hypothetical protein BDR22DRAFT_851822 [Usnea florida]
MVVELGRASLVLWTLRLPTPPCCKQHAILTPSSPPPVHLRLTLRFVALAHLHVTLQNPALAALGPL